MKFKRIFAFFLAFVMTLSFCPAMIAYALSDIDFTIDIDPIDQYVSGDTISCPVKITTQTDNGYVEMELFLTFDPDALNCLTVFKDVDGFSTEVKQIEGETGLLIYYKSPNGEATVKDDNKYVRVQFAVITGVATGEYNLSLKVLSCYGFDSYGNRQNALEKDNVLTLSMAKDKKLNIVETNDNSVGNSTGDGSDPNYYYTEPSATQEVDNKKSGGGSVFGKVVLFILGAAVVFGAGVVVGFILCQKRMNEESFGAVSSEPAAPPRRYAGDSQSPFGNIAGRFGRSVYDEPEEAVSDYYNDRISGRKAAPAKPAAPAEDDDIDTSYFGRAAESQLGVGKTVYDDVYSDGYSQSYNEYTQQPQPQQRQRGFESRSDAQDDNYGSYDFLGSRSRRERSDDGYGAFSSEADDNSGDDNDNDDYFGDRRRYR